MSIAAVLVLFTVALFLFIYFRGGVVSSVYLR